MATSRIQLTYEPKSAVDSGKTYYYTRATVATDPVDLTTPEALDTCLVISRGSRDGSTEGIARVGTYAEVVAPTAGVLPLLPATLDWFESADLPDDLAIGDIITLVDVPLLWKAYGLTGVETTYTVTVTAVDLDKDRAQVTPAFPAFGRSMDYTIYRGNDLIAQGTDGTANRDYGTSTATEFRASSGIQNFGTDLDMAQAWRLAADSAAWDLVKAYDNSVYVTAPETVVYEWQ